MSLRKEHIWIQNRTTMFGSFLSLRFSLSHTVFSLSLSLSLLAIISLFLYLVKMGWNKCCITWIVIHCNIYTQYIHYYFIAILLLLWFLLWLLLHFGKNVIHVNLALYSWIESLVREWYDMKTCFETMPLEWILNLRFWKHSRIGSKRF